MNNTGFIIAIDGPDGSGKTTQLTLLKEWLKKKGYKIHSTRASGGTPIGEELRKASLSNTDRSAEVAVFKENEKGRICRYCKNYIVNPFTQWCSRHKKEVEATDTCKQFKLKPEPDDKTPPPRF